MDYGDIVRRGISQGTVSIKKVDLIEVGDQSPEAVVADLALDLETTSRSRLLYRGGILNITVRLH